MGSTVCQTVVGERPVSFHTPRQTVPRPATGEGRSSRALGLWGQPGKTHAVSSPHPRCWRRRCSAQGEKLQRSGRGPSCRKSCSTSAGAATYTVRTVPKLASHTGPKRETPCTWENRHGGHWRPQPGPSSLVPVNVKGVGWVLQERACFFTGSQLVYSRDAANPSSFSFPHFPSLEV